MPVKKTTNIVLNQNDPKRLRDLGRYYLQSNKIDQALQTYVTLLEKYPDDVGSIIILGDSYLMAGDPKAAKDLYQVALDLEPERKDVQRRITLAENTATSDVGIAGGFPPLHPQAINRLIERLTGKPTSIGEEQIERAAELLNKTIHSDSPATSVSEHLDEIDALLPAILELNIRQARAQGRTDLALDLADLKNSLITDEPDNQNKENNLSIQGKNKKPKKSQGRVILIGKTTVHSPFRQQIIASALREAGFDVEEDWENIPLPWNGFDLVIAHNPHCDPVLLKALSTWAGAGNPVLVDLDTDFRLFSNSSVNENRAFTVSLQLANVITFPSTQTALRFSSEGYRALTVPDGWSQKNRLWLKDAPESSKFNLGLFTVPGQSEDVALIRRAVTRVLREFPQTRLVMSGDPEIYGMFDSIPDTRRIYLPAAEPDDYPYLLAQADIHLFPLRNTDISQLESDRKLMEAGVRKTVWITSPFPAVEEWNAGGCIARSMDDWYTLLKTLILDHDLCNKLAAEGYEKALQREATKMSAIWASVVNKTIQLSKQKPDSGEAK